jgi:hypothetical protein
MDFIENLAMAYLVFAGNAGYNILIVYVAALCVGLIKNVGFRLQRGTYFLNCALIIFAGSLAQIIWFIAAPAIANGFAGVLVLVDIAAWVASGYAYVVVAKARSNDAYGHARYAALSFIPIANL